jgi:hypothetical protein
MRLIEAAAVLEAAVEERARDGLAAEVEALGCEPIDADTVAIYAWFALEEEPLMVIVDLADEISLDCDAIIRALRCDTAPAATVH